MSFKLFNYKLRNKHINFIQICVRKNSVWTPDKVVKSPYKDVDIPKLTIDEYVWRNLDKWATKTAVICGLTNRAYSYEQVYKKSRILAANLRKKLKIKDGDTVAVMLPNMPEYPIVIHGIFAAGGIASTLNPIYTSYEVERLLRLTEALAIVTTRDIVQTVKEALLNTNKRITIISVDVEQNLAEGTISYKELVEEVNADMSILNEVNRDHEDIALLPFSSGTTGLPKAVQLSNSNLVANCQQQNTELRHYTYTTETHQDSLLVVLPLFHLYGLGILMLHKLSVGLKLVTLPKFVPETFLNTLLNNKIKLLYLAPPLVMFLGSHPQVTPNHLEHLSAVISGAAPLPLPDIYTFLEKAQKNTEFIQGYGMTEASPLVTLTPFGQKIYQKVGYALPNIELRIVDAELRNLGPGEIGELLVKGPNVMKGYMKNPEVNSEVFVDGNWLRTGDLSKIDKTGLLTLSGRLKELIKVKGYQVPPAELESVIKEHPSVLDVAVIGIPDSISGEMPKAFVVLKEGSEANAANIVSFVNAKVTSYKKIKEVTFINDIPKNPSGKILRRVLKEKYC